MDERQSQIKEGAGLEESRLNVEFIEWLRKWSTPLLLVVAVVAGLYVLSQRLEQVEINKVNAAFQELEAAMIGPLPSPEALERVAGDYEDVRGVAHMARLSAADSYRTSVIVGYVPGAELNPDGTVANETDLLTPEDRERFLDKADSLYRRVLDETNKKDKLALHALCALFGLAVVAECRGDVDVARGHYEAAATLAERVSYADKVVLARKRIADLDEPATMPEFYESASLPQPPEPEIPDVPATGDTVDAPAFGPLIAPGFEPAPEDTQADGDSSDAAGDDSGADPGDADTSDAGGDDDGGR